MTALHLTADMPEKDPTTYSILTYAWVGLISFWGGLVSFLRKVKAGEARPTNLVEMIGEMVTSGFVGALTFLAAEASDIAPLWTAVLVGITGHMGARALFIGERMLIKILERFTNSQAPKFAALATATATALVALAVPHPAQAADFASMDACASALRNAAKLAGYEQGEYRSVTIAPIGQGANQAAADLRTLIPVVRTSGYPIIVTFNVSVDPMPDGPQKTVISGFWGQHPMGCVVAEPPKK